MRVFHSGGSFDMRSIMKYLLESLRILIIFFFVLMTVGITIRNLFPQLYVHAQLFIAILYVISVIITGFWYRLTLRRTGWLRFTKRKD